MFPPSNNSKPLNVFQYAYCEQILLLEMHTSRARTAGWLLADRLAAYSASTSTSMKTDIASIEDPSWAQIEALLAHYRKYTTNHGAPQPCLETFKGIARATELSGVLFRFMARHEIGREELRKTMAECRSVIDNCIRTASGSG